MHLAIPHGAAAVLIKFRIKRAIEHGLPLGQFRGEDRGSFGAIGGRRDHRLALRVRQANHFGGSSGGSQHGHQKHESHGLH